MLSWDDDMDIATTLENYEKLKAGFDKVVSQFIF